MEADNQLLIIAGSAAVAFIAYKAIFLRSSRLASIPTLGYSNAVLSYIDALRFVTQGRELLAEGYSKYKGGFFKVANLDKWMVLASGPSMVEEIRRIPEDQMSFHQFASESIQGKYTLGPDVMADPYHIGIVHSRLTKSLASVFEDVRDEVDLAFSELIPDNQSDWIALPAVELIRAVVTRASNRVFVGLPLCRDPDYIALNIEYTVQVVDARNKINLLPDFMKPVAGHILSNLPAATKRGVRHLKPIIDERWKKYEEYGLDYPDKPDDKLSWLMDAAANVPERCGADALVRRVLTINFAAIHTSSSTMTHALFHLAANPELWMEPLREEVDRVIKEDGWTKVAMTKMHRVDSFLKESTRLDTFNGFAMMRKALKDHTFSDGTFIPKGTYLACPTSPTHVDDNNYDNPFTFSPWRFSDLRDGDGQGAKHQFVNTNPDYIPFGHGKYACPGRFFAANELKLMIAHLVLNYDVQLEHGSHVRPPNVIFGASCMPNPRAKVCFRKRQL